MNTNELHERVAFLEALVTELQARNTELEERARNAIDHVDQALRVAATNLYKLDWVWAHRNGNDPRNIGSRFWTALRDALGLPAGGTNKWHIDAQHAAVGMAESLHPTKKTVVEQQADYAVKLARLYEEGRLTINKLSPPSPINNWWNPVNHIDWGNK
jgi:hypothetical protein